MNKITGAVLVLAVVAWALVGCASISVEPGTAVATPQRPEKVYVEDFSTAKGEFNVDRDGADLIAFKKNLKVMMTTGITVDLTKRLIPAVAAGTRAAGFYGERSALAWARPSWRRAWRFMIWARARRRPS
jgi:hypothetical protein